MTAPVSLREWDTAFFGLRIAQVNRPHLSADEARDVEAWCAANHIRLCVLLAAADDAETAHVAVRAGYQMVDLRLTLDCDLRHRQVPAPRHAVRRFDHADLPALARIAGESFTDSRFYLDPFFPDHRVAEMYGKWVRQRCGDASAGESMRPADTVFVADAADGQPAGFLTCLRDADAAAGTIDLVAVDSRARGQYIGESMVREALRWFAEQGCHTVNVITQGRNVAAQRTYQRGGFAVRSAQAWYHRWRTHGTVDNPI